MRFPNAQAGVSKLYTAQILMIIAAVLTLVGGIFVAGGNVVVFGIFALIAGIITIIAAIIQIIGLGQAQKDDNYFKTAFFLVIGALVFSVIGSIFAVSSPVVNTIFTLIANIASFLVIFFVIKGIEKVAEKLGDSALVEKARRLFWIILILNAASFILSFVSGLTTNGTVLTIAGILAIIAGIVEIISIILYILLLKRAKESFKA